MSYSMIGTEQFLRLDGEIPMAGYDITPFQTPGIAGHGYVRGMMHGATATLTARQFYTTATLAANARVRCQAMKGYGQTVYDNNGLVWSLLMVLDVRSRVITHLYGTDGRFELIAEFTLQAAATYYSEVV